MRKLFLIPLMILLVGALISGGCAAQAPEEPIKIGSLIPWTGKLADYGPKYKDACELYLGEIGYEVAGRPIEWIWEDSGSDVTIALDKAQKLAHVDKVNIVAGGIWTPALMGLRTFWPEVKIPQITWTSHPIEVVDQGWTFLLGLPMATACYPSGVYAYEEMGCKTGTFMISDYVTGYRFVGGQMQGFEDAGGTIIQKQYVPLGTVDYGPYFAAMEDADFCGFWFPGGATLLFIKQYLEFGLIEKTPLIIAFGDTMWDAFLPDLGERLAGRLGGATVYTNQLDTPASRSFVEAWKSKTGRVPDAYDLHAYETIMAGVAAFEATGGDTDPEKLRQALLNLKLETPAGTLRLDSNGIGIRSLYYMEIQKKDGELVREALKTYPEAEVVHLRPGLTPEE